MLHALTSDGTKISLKTRRFSERVSAMLLKFSLSKRDLAALVDRHNLVLQADLRILKSSMYTTQPKLRMSIAL